MPSKAQRFTKQEELANAISHAIGLILAIAATLLIVATASKYGSYWSVVSNAVFGASMTLLYLSSTLNHVLHQGRLKDFFHNFDQIAIYLLIAGTYTPIALTVIRHDYGWLMFGIEWAFALSGLLIKVFLPNKFEKGVNTFTIISYIIMGWLFIFFIVPLFKNLPGISFTLILLGGFSYTLGVLFFKLEKLPYAHLIWHIMVMLGTACHWTALYLYMLK